MSEEITGFLAALASGVAWGLCFGREPWPVLAWAALVPLLCVLGRPETTRRQALSWGLVHGFATWWVSIPWIIPTLQVFGHLPAWLAVLLMALLCLYLGAFTALFALLARRLARAGGGLALAGLPALWVAVEWLRGTAMGPLTFPWNLAAYAWTDVPGALPLAAWVGPYGISLLVLLANVGLALAVSRRRVEPALWTVGSLLLVLMLGARFSQGDVPPDAKRFAELPAVARGHQNVRIIQPNQEILTTDSVEARAQYDALMAQSRAACDIFPALLLWPESAAWPQSWPSSWELRRDVLELAQQGCHVLLNSPMYVEETGDATTGDAYTNAALLIGPTGVEARYDKQELVPFGERVPFANILPFVGTLARHAGSFTAGETPTLLEWQGERFAVGICYEVMFPGVMASRVRSGATLLVNLSNDAWYGDSSAPRQLFRAARFRAAENRRTLLRAALTGISGVIDRRGEVGKRLGLGERGVLRERVRGSRELSPYTRAPWVMPLLAGLVALVALRLGRRDPATGPLL